ncbi:MAG: FAD-binding oxidoreductase [Ignavibacteria bacterium]|nr:FAD-binding oxidoreductase [Ignavibacteria bacterium]MBT8381922.1 FAD-binding oxidoreductase [Ignavibacteria bacterium]MBT8393143.1 FAD-binding oxidoreductase [Ignavibacteria bacterium]NNJ52637.1 FAD-binding oxidoreductase [Ignavibacteriaceae bacterium]NNL21137.1 FAD-binding oxidoreductase [Ignavibacteriaceae bacterium]
MIVKKEKDQIQDYLKDASNTEGFCDAVFFPESVKDLQDIFKAADEKKIQITVSGNRTGLTGAAVPKGGIVISTAKLNKIIEINKEEKFVVVEPGVLLSDLIKELKSQNLYYPPDPTELNCFIGGVVATNASGSKSFKYGATRSFVSGLEILLPTGELLNLQRGENYADSYEITFQTDKERLIEIDLPEIEIPVTKNAAGFFCKKNMDAIDLFIGSEGTLGVFTKIKLSLLDYPKSIFSTVIFFNEEMNALNFIHDAREFSYNSRKKNRKNTINATALEFFDKNSLKFLKNNYTQIPTNAAGAVWFEQETSPEIEELLINSIAELIEKHNGNFNDSWLALTEKDRTEIENFRHSISAKVNEYITSHNFRKLGTDIAVPDDKLFNFYFQVVNDVKKNNLNYVVYGHFGNSHLHLNMLPKNNIEFMLAQNLYRQFCEDAINLGGTFSAEHGVGKNKKEYLIKMYGAEAVKKMIGIKKKFDSELLLGIGNVFDTEEQN